MSLWPILDGGGIWVWAHGQNSVLVQYLL